MDKLLRYLTEEITGNKDIEISQEDTEGVTNYTIKAPQSVMGMLIGKSGKTIRAIRSVCKARAIIDQTNINIRLEEKAE